MLVLYVKRCTTEGAISGSYGVCSLCCLVVVFTLLFSSFLLCSCYFSSELALIKNVFFSLPPLTEGRMIACALRAKTAGLNVCLLSVTQIPIE